MESTILIVDDHQLVIDGIESLIEAEDSLRLVGTANDGKRGVEKALALKPDLILMDMDMPQLNGMEASQQILQANKDQKIAILSMYSEKAIVERLDNLGIMGYILKTADRDELISGIKTILSGKKYYHPEVVTSILSGNTKMPKYSNASMVKLGLLSEREKEILSAIAEGMTSQEIGDKLHISSRTVETHRKNIHTKLDIKNLAGLIRFAIGSGLAG